MMSTNDQLTPASGPDSQSDAISLISLCGISLGLLAAAVLMLGFWSPSFWFGEQPPVDPVSHSVAANVEADQPKDVAIAPESAGAAPRVTTFDDIKFDMKKGDPWVPSMLTPKIEQLKGTRIKLRGYMLPSFKQKGLKEFVLVRDNQECCFGPGAALYDCVLIHMTPGNSTSFSTRPIAVDGIFTIEEFKDPDGKHLAIYRMDATSAQ